ncbi:MAG: ABC transporter permease [Metallibacterium scheffleri]|jgi:ABC-type antimicrobial peptide transport system permease subunit|uniref:ABC transporter permease n=1 Tax=Metallibacterium scheffleri TaxID=993689 RepID=UPI0026F0BE0F|nr:ABC transporter permease [Metallibacterium scheffleri]MCK9367005.1 ABC transporter permease [Metallibacterium scheffleri]
MRNNAWMQIGAYALLALAIAATALAFATLRVLDTAGIPGAAPGYRYYTLGVMRSTGPSFAISSATVEALQGNLVDGLRAGMAMSRQGFQVRMPTQAGMGRAARGELVTGTYLQALHPKLQAGRLLGPTDMKPCIAVAVISASLARTLYDSPAAAVGRSLMLASKGRPPSMAVRVVGVLAAGFHGAYGVPDTALWLPLSLAPEINHMPSTACTAKPPHAAGAAASTRITTFSIVGPPAVLSAPADVTRAQLTTLLDNAWHRLPASARGKDQLGLVVSAPFSLSPQARLQAAHRTTLYLALAIAALVLATINLFTLRWLALVRRRHVLQLERVLGATRGFLRRRYVLRTAVLALALLLASVALSALGYWALHALTSHDSVLWASLSLSALAGELAWALPVLLLIVVLAEALPLLVLLQRERIDGGSRVALSRADRGIGIGVLVAEVMLAAVMSCAAGWALRYAWQQRHAELGMLRAPASVVTITRKPGSGPDIVSITTTTTTTTNQSGSSTVRSVSESAQGLLLHALRAALASALPGHELALGPLPGNEQMTPPDSYTAGNRATSALGMSASPQWLRVASASLLAGSDFSARQPDPKAVLIDAKTARALFGHVRAAIGQTLQSGMPASTLRVIGVIAPLYLQGPDHDAEQVVIGDARTGIAFFPLIGGNLLVRPRIGTAQHAQLRAALDAALQRQAPTLQVTRVESSQELLAHLTATQTRQAQVFLAIALFAWAIALSGVAAHLRLYLAMRRRLAAIRSALGAGPRRLYGEVLGGTLVLAGAGIALSLLAAPWLAQQFALLSGAQVAPFGWATWIALAVLLLAVFLVAHFPARRAARAEPAASLHEL